MKCNSVSKTREGTEGTFLCVLTADHGPFTHHSLAEFLKTRHLKPRAGVGVVFGALGLHTITSIPF